MSLLSAASFLLKAGNWRNLFKFVGGKALIFLGAGTLVGLIAFGIEVAFAFSLQQFLVVVGVMAESGGVPKWMQSLDLNSVLVMVFLLGAFRAFLQWCHFFLTQTIIEVFTYDQRVRLIDWAFFGSSASSGQVVTFFNEIIANCSYFLSGIQSLFIIAPTTVLLFVSLMYIAPVPTLIASLCLLLAALVMRSLNKKTVDISVSMFGAYNRGANQLMRGVKNLLLLHIYGTQKKEELEILKNLERARNEKIYSFKLAATKYAFPQVVGIAAICVITVSASKTGSLASSLLISYFYLFIRFVQTFAEATKTGSTLLFTWNQSRSLYQWWMDSAFDGLHQARERVGQEVPPTPFPHPVGWELEDVSFTYPGANVPVLRSVSMRVNPGQTVVITGPSGAGKSTLLNLLLGGIGPNAGKVRLIPATGAASEPLGSHRARLLESIGYVGPESFLVDGTVRDNVLYGIRHHAADPEIWAALEKAECRFLHEFPGKLDHKLTEQGQGLSAGQKQRLSLARALLRKPKVLILDEATANLDEDTESRLIQTLDNLKGEMTMVVVTHRRGLLKIADSELRLS